MPRPVGKAIKIAKKVIPGFSYNGDLGEEKPQSKTLSHVEKDQTKTIESRKGLVMSSTKY